VRVHEVVKKPLRQAVEGDEAEILERLDIDLEGALIVAEEVFGDGQELGVSCVGGGYLLSNVEVIPRVLGLAEGKCFGRVWLVVGQLLSYYSTLHF
jgi:hypothetical protein